MAPGIPDVDAPPTIATGADAALFRKIMREEIDRNKQAIAAPDAAAFREIVHDECDKLRAEFFDIFDDLDMPLDKEHRKATREKLGDLFEMHRKGQAFKAEFWSQLWKLLTAWILGILTIIGGYIGIKGGGSH